MRIDITFSLGRSFLDDDILAKVKDVLDRVATTWVSGLHVYGGRKQKIPVDCRSAAAFVQQLKTSALARGDRYNDLVRRFGAGPYSRQIGSVELRGSNRSLIVVLSMDEWVFAPSAGRWLFANSMTIQVDATNLEGRAASVWARWAFEVGAECLAPSWASARAIEEYASKNLSREDGCTQAIGLDVSKYLPGMYWLNFFGRAYCDLMGRDRLLSAPAAIVKPLDHGILIGLAEAPGDWSSDEYAERESGVIEYLGPEYFFDRRRPDRPSRAPAFSFNFSTSRANS